MKFVSLTKLLIVCILCLSICGCRSNGNTSSQNNADTYQSEEKLETQNNVSSEIQTNEFIDSDMDPLNTENIKPEGQEVKIEKIQPKKGMLNGIDVSKWQGKIDWQKVKKSGIDFAIIRIGYRGENGEIYSDSYAHYNIQQATKAGVLTGVYFFSTAVNIQEAKEEAEWVYNNIKSYSISLPVVYDCEGFQNAGSRMYSLSVSQRTQNALEFINQIKSYGYDAMFYASKSDLINCWDTSKIEASAKIWVAHYDAVTYPQVETPQYSGAYEMWQYTNKGIVSGISGSVDLVVSYSQYTKKEPKSNAVVNEVKAPEPEDKTYTSVDENVTAKDIVNLRESASPSAKILGELKNGEILRRIGKGTNGWSKLQYNGKTVYAISSYLTTDVNYKKPIESSPTASSDDGFTVTNDTVTPKISVNLREKPTTNSNVLTTVENGVVLTRIGKNDTNGWSKISYEGKTMYAVTSMLTTDLNYKDTSSSNSTVIENGMQFTSVNEQVTAKIETHLRDKPVGGGGSNVVVTLKNGEFVTRTGYSEQGWSKVIWNGQTLYAVSSLLTTEQN